MNNQRSPIEQFILIALLSFGAFTLWQHYSGNNNKGGNSADKPAPALNQAFAGLDPASGGAVLTGTKALSTVKTLQQSIAANGKDEYSYWARLRIGLIQQYALANPIEARKSYDEVIHRNQNESLDAQAIYQKGDLLLRQSQGDTAKGNAATGQSTPPSTSLTAEQKAALHVEGAQALEQIQTRGRGHQAFLQQKIFVPDINSARGDPLALPARWEELSLEQLLGKGSILPANTTAGIDPRFILTRVDSYYATTPLYKVFDAVVNWFGAKPAYSYGLALITLALVTRLLMQPLIKKQYDSMKGMSLIAPEMKKIQDRYKGKTDPESQRKMMQEIRDVQKQHGVNPMGCGLSLVIQMPLFFFIVLPLINHYQARMELSGAHFGWIKSLAHPDIPLLVLYAISMFVSVRLSATPPADEQQAQMQKMTTFMSPLFALVLWSYPSAFILYWFTYNALSTALQWRMMKASDPNKNAIKTLMGTGIAPVPSASTDAKTATNGAVANGAIPPRPSSNASSKSSKKSTLITESAFEESLNGVSKDISKNGANEAESAEGEEDSPLETHGGKPTVNGKSSSNGKSGSGNSSAARRRRRRK